MIPEDEYKKKLIKQLNTFKNGWVDGDQEKGEGKRADIVNHRLKIAIEIKDDTNYKIIPDGQVRVNDLTLMNKRLADQVKSANKKFKSYPNYKTILLLRSDHIAGVLLYALEGLDQYQYREGELTHTGKVGKYSKYAKNEVGGFLIVTHRAVYKQNYLSNSERFLTLEELKKLTGWSIDEPQ